MAKVIPFPSGKAPKKTKTSKPVEQKSLSAGSAKELASTIFAGLSKAELEAIKRDLGKD